MRKLLFLIIGIGIISMVSCVRQEQTNPDPSGPAGYKYIVEGSADPSILLANGTNNPTTILVRVTDYLNNPLTGRTVYFEQRSGDDHTQRIDWGYFTGNKVTSTGITDSQGYVSITYYGPDSILGSDQLVYIKATVADQYQSYFDPALPYDYIAIRIISD